MQPLRKYQEDAVEAILSGKSQFLALAPGLGKTRTAIEIINRMGAKNVLILCPATVKLVWRDEIKKWSPAKVWVEIPERSSAVKGQATRHPRYRIVNYDKLSRIETGFLDELKKCGPFDVIVSDEAHLLKTVSSARTKAVYDKGGLFERCGLYLPLSATPAVGNASELYPHLKAMVPERIQKPCGITMSLNEFIDAYCDTKIIRLNNREIKTIQGSKNVGDLRKRMGSFIYKKTKTEVLPDLPPLQFTTVPLDITNGLFTPENSTPYKELNDDEFIKAVQSDDHISRQIVELGSAKAVAAVRYIHDFLVDAAPTLKVLIWFTNTAPLDYAMKHLGQFHPVRIDGRDSQTAREFAIHKFLTDHRCKIFCGNIKAAGTGITLQSDTVAPTDVFFVQSSFSPGDNIQAAARSHRMTTKGAVLCRTFVADGSWLDNRIQQIITRKTNELAELI
jgi:SWI/SNF-related matrix-associated actin-dependent regulator 1 of chromatin subfamily A